MASSIQTSSGKVGTASTGSGPARGDSHLDCRVCPVRPRCISYGWMSPGGIWFENAVVLRPIPDCRGYEGRSADIFGHFGGRAADTDAIPEPK